MKHLTRHSSRHYSLLFAIIALASMIGVYASFGHADTVDPTPTTVAASASDPIAPDASTTPSALNDAPSSGSSTPPTAPASTTAPSTTASDTSSDAPVPFHARTSTRATDEQAARSFASRDDHHGINVQVLRDQDLNSSDTSSPDSISEMSFKIYIANNTKKNMPLMKIRTGIKEGTLNYIRVEGATGYTFENSELVLAYVSLRPGESTIVTVTGIPLISADDISFDITPTVRDRSGTSVGTAPTVRERIAGKTFTLSNRFRTSVRRSANIDAGTNTSGITPTISTSVSSLSLFASSTGTTSADIAPTATSSLPSINASSTQDVFPPLTTLASLAAGSSTAPQAGSSTSPQSSAPTSSTTSTATTSATSTLSL